MAIGTPLGFGTPLASGNANTATPQNLPAGIPGPSYALAIVCNNITGSATFSDGTSQWTLLDTVTNGSNTNSAALWGRTVTSTDSSATLSFSTSATGRFAMAGLVIPGAASTLDTTPTEFNLASTQDPTYPSVTPVTADDLLVLLTSQLMASGSGPDTTVSAPWSEITEQITGNATGNKVSAFVAARQLTGGAGVAQAGPTTHKNYTGNNIGWIFAVKPTGTTPPAGPTVSILNASGVETAVTVSILNASGVEVPLASVTAY